ncbi:MAG: FG-GAP-like repeat-containing protein [Isosphaeraceae bacterium]|nr:FG-GAP-like repeat-containing protein [Isosphaeraceae bacterium]
MTGRGLFIKGCFALACAGLSWALFGLVSDRRYHDGLERTRRQIALGRFAEARPWLAVAFARSSGDSQIAYLFGLCEQAAGRTDGARKAWASVTDSSSFAVAARRALAKLEVDSGRFADAEVVLEAVIGDGGPNANWARYQLSQLYFWEGRDDDQRRILRAGWEHSQDRAGDLRDLWLVDTATVLVDSTRNAVERAFRLAPDDDRVWLAQAHVATLAGRFGEAGARLDDCRRRRPGDPVVWRARLRWAVAADRFQDAAGTLAHLPADRFDPAAVAKLHVWFAARRNDPVAERASLERLVELNPGDTSALERLAVLAAGSGRADQAAQFRARKTEADHATDRYGRLIGTSGPITDFAELARLAESLGRWFDAHAWWTLLLLRNPDEPGARLSLNRLDAFLRPNPHAWGKTLATLLADVSSNPRQASRPPAGPNERSPLFRDDADVAGLHFSFENGRSALRQLPETSSGGVGLLDYDGDGWLDVYVVQGGSFPPDRSRPGSGDRLFRNQRDGTFVDTTEQSRIARFARGYGHGVAVGDYDNDGHPDLFVTRWQSYALYRNRGDGTFEDATETAALGGPRDWPTSAAWADLDNDGDLDLYVCHYLAWDAAHPRLCKVEGADDPMRLEYCTPRQFPALPDHLFRNDHGRFVDVSVAAGITEADKDGRGFGVVAADLDDDGQVDLFVANDTTANFLFHNDGGLKFTECGLSAGVASNANGGFQAGMGAACGDLDGDGRPDILVTNFYGESTSFYRNLGALFEDGTTRIGLAAPSRYLLGFGIVLLDANNDGYLDIMTANGHVNDERPRFPYEMPPQLLVGGPQGKVTDVSATSGPPWQVKCVGRGLAAGDLDNDGRVDAILLAQNAPLSWFHNQTERAHFITIQLEGTTSNRDAVGARVDVVPATGRRQVAQRTGGGSFQSASEGRLHFGLGASDRVDTVEVRWPSGRRDRYEGLQADRIYRLQEGLHRAEPLPAYTGR